MHISCKQRYNKIIISSKTRNAAFCKHNTRYPNQGFLRPPNRIKRAPGQGIVPWIFCDNTAVHKPVRECLNNCFWVCEGASPLRRYLQANTRLPPMRGSAPQRPGSGIIQTFLNAPVPALFRLSLEASVPIICG